MKFVSTLSHETTFCDEAEPRPGWGQGVVDAIYPHPWSGSYETPIVCLTIIYLGVLRHETARGAAKQWEGV